jgi:excisionase family DNA binding protein
MATVEWLYSFPCKDTGKKTRRFTIQTKDLISYLTLLETSPEALPIPTGIFSSEANGQAKENPYLLINSEKFAAFLHTEWRTVPDALSVKEASKLLGYSCGAVDHWISKGRLKAVRYHNSYLIPKDALINHMASLGNNCICQKSEKHLKLICRYTGQQ